MGSDSEGILREAATRVIYMYSYEHGRTLFNFGPNSVMGGLRASQASHVGGPKQLCSIKVSIGICITSVGTLVGNNSPLVVFIMNPRLATGQNMKCEISKLSNL